MNDPGLIRGCVNNYYDKAECVTRTLLLSLGRRRYRERKVTVSNIYWVKINFNFIDKFIMPLGLLIILISCKDIGLIISRGY